MPTNLMRRRLLAVAAGTATLPLARWAAAAGTQLTLQPLGDGLALVTGAGGPVVVADSGSELLLVDGGLAANAAELAGLLTRQFPGRRVGTLINTHWHWDRTGANELFAGQGARLVAHENTRLWLGAEINCAWEPRVYPPRPAKAQPTQTFFYGTKTLPFAGQQVEYGYLPQAHTDGDLYVYFPRQNVLVAGDVATGRSYPILDYSTNGWAGGMVTGLKSLMARCDVHTRIVGSGAALLGKTDLVAQQDMVFAVLTRIGQSYYKGETWEQFLASAPTQEFDAAFGDPARFLRTAYEGAWGHVNEIRRVTR